MAAEIIIEDSRPVPVSQITRDSGNVISMCLTVYTANRVQRKQEDFPGFIFY